MFGLNWDCRPTAIRSACPFLRIASACCASRMMPTAIEAMPTSFRTLSAYGTWKPRPRGTCAAVAEPEMPPEEQSITSTPRAFNSRAKATVSSRFHPSFAPSTAETRTNKGMVSGISRRTASTISSGRRMRPLRSPPYSSLRVLETGERNEASR